jgi:hypothetical protein
MMPNTSLEPTAVGAASFAIAGNASTRLHPPSFKIANYEVSFDWTG